MTTIKPFRAWFYVATYVSALLCPFGVRAQDLTINFTGAFQNNTCTITTPSIMVNMGQVDVNDITAVGVGSAIPTSSSFTIQANCPLADPTFTLNDANNGSPSTTLTLTPGGGVASGVGIQLFQNGYPNTPITVGVPIGWLANPGQISVSYKARYSRTATTVTAGTANALALFTLTYP
jgi:major type 1 subunit fimbrin (pilin)